MTALPIIANVFRVAFNWANDVDGQISENVMHFRGPGLVAVDLGPIIQAALQVHQWAPLPTTWGLDTLSVTALDGGSATVTYSLTGGHVEGESTGDWSPASAAVVSLTTDQRGRSYRGRIFLGPCAESAINDGRLVLPLPAEMVTAWEAFNAAAIADGLSHGVASYKHATFNEVLTYAVQAGIGTQRRRQTRVRYP